MFSKLIHWYSTSVFCKQKQNDVPSASADDGKNKLCVISIYTACVDKYNINTIL